MSRTTLAVVLGCAMLLSACTAEPEPVPAALPPAALYADVADAPCPADPTRLHVDAERLSKAARRFWRDFNNDIIRGPLPVTVRDLRPLYLEEHPACWELDTPLDLGVVRTRRALDTRLCAAVNALAAPGSANVSPQTSDWGCDTTPGPAKGHAFRRL